MTPYRRIKLLLVAFLVLAVGEGVAAAGLAAGQDGQSAAVSSLISTLQSGAAVRRQQHQNRRQQHSSQAVKQIDSSLQKVLVGTGGQQAFKTGQEGPPRPDDKGFKKGNGLIGDKHQDYEDAFSGGRAPQHTICTTIPGCQFCPGRKECTACWYKLGVARFAKTRRGRCQCPPGFGIRDPDFHPPSLPGPCNSATPATSQSTDPSTQASCKTAAASIQFSNASNQSLPLLLQKGKGGVISSPYPILPAWADKCLPCPPGTFSTGGAIGTARCQICANGTTSFGTASSCVVSTTCQAGQQPATRSQGCVPCPTGTYQPKASVWPCLPCPANTTTLATGAVTRDECSVPVCLPGQQLSTYTPPDSTRPFYWCINCTGTTWSPGGRTDQGTRQPRCRECPEHQVPTLDRTRCSEFICPPPDSFFISCDTPLPSDFCREASADPIYLPQFCSAFPIGAEITWFRGFTTDPNPVFPFQAQPDLSTPVNPPVAFCPVDTQKVDVFYPYITSFNGREDCLCPRDKVNCNFRNGIPTPGMNSPVTTAQSPPTFVYIFDGGLFDE